MASVPTTTIQLATDFGTPAPGPATDGFILVWDNAAGTFVLEVSELAAHVAAADPHPVYQKESERGIANGYASLDAGGTVPDAQIPAAIARDAEVAAVYATKVYADTLVVGLLDDRGNHDASGDVFPSTGGSGSAGAVLKGDLWTISVAGTLGGTAVTAGDVIRALVDSPGQTASNWAIAENNLGYVPAPATRTITAGAGLTGGGDLSVDRTLNAVGTADRITVSADNIDIADTYAGQTSITIVGTIATGVWQGTDIAIADGGTGQSTAQAAINALTAVAGATNEHVLTKDTATGNAVFKASSGGATFTPGSIPFAGSSGALTQNNDDLFWDEVSEALILGDGNGSSLRLGQILELNKSANYGGLALTSWSATNGHAPLLDLNKSGSNTPGVHSIVANGELLGAITWRGSDGTALQDAAQITVLVDGTPGTGDMPTTLNIGTSPDGTASPTVKIAVKPNGVLVASETTQTLGFYGTVPVARPAGIPDAVGGAVIDAQARAAINAVIASLETLGLIATV